MPICVSYGSHTVSCLPSPQHIVGAVPVTGVPILGGALMSFWPHPQVRDPFSSLSHLCPAASPTAAPGSSIVTSPGTPPPPQFLVSEFRSLTSAGRTSPHPTAGLSGLVTVPMLQKCSGVSSQLFSQASHPREDALTRVIAFFIVCQQLNYWLIGTQNG